MAAVIQIPNLPAVIALNGTELFEAVQAGTSVKVSALQIATYIQATPLAALTFTSPLVRTADNVTLTTVPVTLGGTGVTGFGVVTSKTASYAVLAADSYKDFDNNGAAGTITFTLPASTVGLAYGFAVMEAQNVVIDAPGGVTIYLGEISTTAGGTITSNAVGSYLFIKCRSATEWIVQSSMGTWTPA